MSVVIRTRSAVSPLRRDIVAYPVLLPTVDEVVAVTRPEEPIHCLRPVAVAETAQAFVQAFPGDVLYAVKCNPDPAVLRALWDGGVRHFDCASLSEIRLVRDMFPEAAIHFMHPIKARGAIREAWARHDVRDFVLDLRLNLPRSCPKSRRPRLQVCLGWSCASRCRRAVPG